MPIDYSDFTSNGSGVEVIIFLLLFFAIPYLFTKVCNHIENKRYENYIKQTRGGNENE